MLEPDYTNLFKKDKKLMERRHKDMLKLADVTFLVINEIPLPPQYKQHPLHGNYEGTLECHIEPDWLLVYEINEETKTVIFQRTGSHSDLF
jgi:mRNA interferase YafQ